MMPFSESTTRGVQAGVWALALTAALAGAPAHGAQSSAAEVPALTSIPAAKAMFSIDSGDARLERNKANVIAFYDLAFNQSQPAQAMQRYAGARYTQHNSEVADGPAGFIAYFEQMARDYPGKSIEFKRVFAEGQYVIVHSEHKFPGWRGGSWAAIDIFRLDEAGKIVEHWDTLQKVPSSMPHRNGMF